MLNNSETEAPAETAENNAPKEATNKNYYGDIATIFSQEPDDNPEIESASVNNSDFDNEVPKVEPEPDTQTKTEPEKKREAELSEKAKEIKKKFLKQLSPSLIVGFSEMILSRIGASILIRTNKDNWKLDPEEKDFAIEALDVTIEEEGIEFWPAKYWLILGLLFFYGMKAWSNYTNFYTDNVVSNKRKELEEMKRNHELAQLEIDTLSKEVELIEKKAILNAKKYRAEQAIKKDILPSELNIKDPDKSEDNIELLKREYPPEIYVWQGDTLVTNNDGSPKKRPGAKKGTTVYKHPISGAFISKEEFERLVSLGHSIDDQEHVTITE